MAQEHHLSWRSDTAKQTQEGPLSGPKSLEPSLDGAAQSPFLLENRALSPTQLCQHINFLAESFSVLQFTEGAATYVAIGHLQISQYQQPSMSIEIYRGKLLSSVSKNNNAKDTTIT